MVQIEKKSQTAEHQRQGTGRKKNHTIQICAREMTKRRRLTPRNADRRQKAARSETKKKKKRRMSVNEYNGMWI